MSKERTLSILKPDSVKNHHIGAILQQFEKNHLQIVGMKMVKLQKSKAEGFYAEHSQRPFFASLVEFMCSGPVVLFVLEGDSAVSKTREIMGATDPKKADPGTIRALFGASIDHNAIHGSDSPTSAEREIHFFFEPSELL